MLQSIEGVYKHGKIELSELPLDLLESRVIVTFLESGKTQPKRQMMKFAMFYGDKKSREEDFQIAEFNADDYEELD